MTTKQFTAYIVTKTLPETFMDYFGILDIYSKETSCGILIDSRPIDLLGNMKKPKKLRLCVYTNEYYNYTYSLHSRDFKI